ncbi:transporter, major facilitator family [marine gamma proteobacterium HTCC2148]|nr:transporter, major facilitator family [marine gamma proteobacterium HTCC2148]
MSDSNRNHYDKPKAAYYALGMLTLVYAFNFIDRQLLAILQESIKADLSLSDSQLGLLTGFAFAIFYVTAGIPIARWADHANRRNIVAGSLFIWSFMTALSGMVQNYTQLVLARIGVGIGEAGGSPPSHSMISDIFPPNRRATALGFYSTGVSFGILFGFLFGGWLNEYFGWRTAFLVVGIPGVFLSGLIMLTLREPTRGLIEQKTVTAESVPLKKVIQTLWESRTFRHLSLAASLNAFSGYSTASWTASFMIRSHEMSTGELGTWLAIIIGLCGAIGVFFGGMAADWLSPRDKRWYMWLPAISGFIAVPFMVAVYLADTPYVALSMMLIPGLLHQVYLGNTLATTHNLVGLKMRATSSAILFFILNIIGLGCGPFLVGVLSDQLSASHGADSLRLAMLYLLPAVMFWSACHFYFASKHLRKDLEAAPA